MGGLLVRLRKVTKNGAADKVFAGRMVLQRPHTDKRTPDDCRILTAWNASAQGALFVGVKLWRVCRSLPVLSLLLWLQAAFWFGQRPPRRRWRLIVSPI
jgi:hypothetical protein